MNLNLNLQLSSYQQYAIYSSYQSIQTNHQIFILRSSGYITNAEWWVGAEYMSYFSIQLSSHHSHHSQLHHQHPPQHLGITLFTTFLLRFRILVVVFFHCHMKQHKQYLIYCLKQLDCYQTVFHHLLAIEC